MSLISEWPRIGGICTAYKHACKLLDYSTSREVKCGHVTRWTNLLMTTCFDTLRYLSYSLYNFEIKLPKREQQMLNACFEPVVIVFCCVIRVSGGNSDLEAIVTTNS